MLILQNIKRNKKIILKKKKIKKGQLNQWLKLLLKFNSACLNRINKVEPKTDIKDISFISEVKSHLIHDLFSF